MQALFNAIMSEIIAAIRSIIINDSSIIIPRKVIEELCDTDIPQFNRIKLLHNTLKPFCRYQQEVYEAADVLRDAGIHVEINYKNIVTECTQIVRMLEAAYALQVSSPQCWMYEKGWTTSILYQN